MHFFTASNRNASLAGDVIRIEPCFASEAKTLEALFEAHGAGAVLRVPDALAAARRLATRQSWARGPRAWNDRASQQIDFMRRLGGQPSGVRLLQQVFAADFSETSLDSGLDAGGVTFAGDLLLSRATLGGALRLDGARLLASFVATDARIAHELTAEQAQFVGPAVMDGLDVSRAARFGFSDFLSDLVFDRARFGKELWLRNARVTGVLSARGALLESDAGLGACVYGGAVVFDDTTFRDTVSFEGASCLKGLSLDRCVFEGRLRLDGIDLSGGLSVRGARFRGEVTPPLEEVAKGRSPQHDMLDKLRRELR